MGQQPPPAAAAPQQHQHQHQQHQHQHQHQHQGQQHQGQQHQGQQGEQPAPGAVRPLEHVVQTMGIRPAFQAWLLRQARAGDELIEGALELYEVRALRERLT